MSNTASLYWLTRLDYIQGIFIATSIIGGIGLLAFYVWWTVEGEYDYENYKDYKRS